MHARRLDSRAMDWGGPLFAVSPFWFMRTSLAVTCTYAAVYACTFAAQGTRRARRATTEAHELERSAARSVPSSFRGIFIRSTYACAVVYAFAFFANDTRRARWARLMRNELGRSAVRSGPVSVRGPRVCSTCTCATVYACTFPAQGTMRARKATDAHELERSAVHSGPVFVRGDRFRITFTSAAVYASSVCAMETRRARRARMMRNELERSAVCSRPVTVLGPRVYVHCSRNALLLASTALAVGASVWIGEIANGTSASFGAAPDFTTCRVPRTLRWSRCPIMQSSCRLIQDLCTTAVVCQLWPVMPRSRSGTSCGTMLLAYLVCATCCSLQNASRSLWRLSRSYCASHLKPPTRMGDRLQ